MFVCSSIQFNDFDWKIILILSLFVCLSFTWKTKRMIYAFIPSHVLPPICVRLLLLLHLFVCFLIIANLSFLNLDHFSFFLYKRAKDRRRLLLLSRQKITVKLSCVWFQLPFCCSFRSRNANHSSHETREKTPTMCSNMNFFRYVRRIKE